MATKRLPPRSEPLFPDAPLSNERIADLLDEIAELLEHQNANAFRVRAYRTAAARVRDEPESVHRLLQEEGLDGLTQIPGIGQSLARTIERLASDGRVGLLERLRGQDEPVRLLATVAGVGPKFARRLHEQLGVETLQDLETAAHDGRLATVPGMGRKRLAAVRDSLAGRFRRRARATARPAPPPTDQPTVAELLDVDWEYRERAEAGRLPLIAPHRFNPTGAAWLPVLHTQRESRHYTALFSNTARAHELGTTHDWVVVYRDDPGGAGQWTVVTARLGPCRGRRIIRGREQECDLHYAAAEAAETQVA